MYARGLATLAISALIGCGQTSPNPPEPSERLPQAAYVWQRNWTPAVRDAVSHPPAGIDSLRVLIAEVSKSADLTMVSLDAASLAAAHLPVTIVVRIEGSRPIEALSLAPIVSAGDALRERGVNVAGIEIDHDCATARLGDYAGWLYDQRPSASRYRFSITALPTWASSGALIDVANAVDEIVVQVHAVRAPTIFDANIAWRDLTRFARVVRAAAIDTRRITTLRVSLPTYRAVVRDVEVSVDPDDVAAFVDRLHAKPIEGIDGVVWFRLPVEGDEQTWSRATFARVVGDRAPLAQGRATIELVAQGDSRFDIVVSNSGDTLVEMPSVHVAGDIGAADMVMGYLALGPGRWEAPRKSIAPSERIVIGWIHGKDLSLVD